MLVSVTVVFAREIVIVEMAVLSRLKAVVRYVFAVVRYTIWVVVFVDLTTTEWMIVGVVVMALMLEDVLFWEIFVLMYETFIMQETAVGNDFLIVLANCRRIT